MSCLWFASIRHAPGSPLSCWCERSPFAWLAECECVSLSPSVSTYLWKYHSDLTLEVRSTCTPITPQLITSACTRRAPHNSFVRVCVALDLFANGLLSLSSSPSDLYQSHFLIAAIRLGVRKPQMRWSAFGFVPKKCVLSAAPRTTHRFSHTHIGCHLSNEHKNWCRFRCKKIILRRGPFEIYEACVSGFPNERGVDKCGGWKQSSFK